MALKLTKARGQEGGANHPRANGAGWNWVANRHEGVKGQEHGKHQVKGPFGRIH